MARPAAIASRISEDAQIGLERIAISDDFKQPFVG
jgi:hypothetical protein